MAVVRHDPQRSVQAKRRKDAARAERARNLAHAARPLEDTQPETTQHAEQEENMGRRRRREPIPKHEASQLDELAKERKTGKSAVSPQDRKRRKKKAPKK